MEFYDRIGNALHVHVTRAPIHTLAAIIYFTMRTALYTFSKECWRIARVIVHGQVRVCAWNFRHCDFADIDTDKIDSSAVVGYF